MNYIIKLKGGEEEYLTNVTYEVEDKLVIFKEPSITYSIYNSTSTGNSTAITIPSNTYAFPLENVLMIKEEIANTNGYYDNSSYFVGTDPITTNTTD